MGVAGLAAQSHHHRCRRLRRLRRRHRHHLPTTTSLTPTAHVSPPPLPPAVRVHKMGYFPADVLVLDASAPSEVLSCATEAPR